MKKKVILGFIGAVVFNWSWAASLSAPTYIKYDESFSEKKSAVKDLIEGAKAANSKNIYIYYHDAKSQNMATNIQDRIQNKLPGDAKVTVVDQNSGSPKYPAGSTTPDGVAIFYETSK